VDIADNVEGTVLVAFVVVQWHSLDRGGIDLFGALQHEDVPEALFGEAPQRPPQLGLLLADHVEAEATLVAEPIALVADPLGQVQHDGDRKAVVLSGECDERLARFWLHVGRVDDRQAAQRQPLRGDEVQDLKGIVRHRLIVLVVADRRSAGVRRQHFGRQKVLARKGTLARTGRADKDNKGQVRNRDLHQRTLSITDALASAQHPSEYTQGHTPHDRYHLSTHPFAGSLGMLTWFHPEP
jgi:hypothetical protein